MSSTLPPPGDEARVVSDALLARLGEVVTRQGGCLPFERYMSMALYEPGLGYYSNGLTPFGEQGDFITAPESGALFGRCLARCIASVIQQVGRGDVLELGAGSGVLARVVLQELQKLEALPERYYILERSAAMRALQAQTLADDAALVGRIEWLDELPAEQIDGVIFANEVADALPVDRFGWRGGEVYCQGIGFDGGRLVECETTAGPEMSAHVRRLAADYAWPDDYRSEYCASLPAWVASLCDCISRGALLLVDYGYGRAEYYHPQRSMGTLMCHYRHHAHPDPLWYPGLQDITAFVDFTSIAEAATGAGLRFTGYASQAQFLAGCGIDQLLAEVDPADTRRYLRLANEAKRLMLPGEMGERFKCIGFSRDLQKDVLGFSPRDLRGRL